jgi:hypothetical protein
VILTSEDEGVRLFETSVYCGGDVSFQKTRIFIYVFMVYLLTGSRGSSVGIATRYGLERLGIE